MMIESKELSNYSSLLETLELNFNNNEVENAQIRCPICSNLVNIIEANFKENIFSINCDKEHKDNLLTYNSFSSFIENVSKNIENFLCNTCKKLKKETKLFRCDNCYLFLCEECKKEHEKNFLHLNFISINDIDKNSNDKFLSNSEVPRENDIIKEYNNIKDNIKICKKISKLFYEWINELTKKFENYINLLNNYLCFEKVIVSDIKKYYDLKQININNIILQNYEFLYPNKYFINNYVQSINHKLNLESKLFKDKSLIILKIIQNFDEIDNYFKINQKPLDLSNKSKSEQLNIKNNINIEEKISEMEIEKIDIGQIQCFDSFRNEKYLTLGLKYGNMSIYEINQNLENKNEKLKHIINIKIFEDDIKHIFAINKNIIIISDGKNTIKAIKFEDDILKYSIIQTIYLYDNSQQNLIYKIIPLLLFSDNSFVHLFCVADDNNILIYKQNNIKENNLFYEHKKIQLNTISQSLIEVNNKYLIASCPKKYKIIFFDIKNDFKEMKEIKEIKAANGSNTLALIHDNKILVVGVIDGFELISIQNFSKIKSIRCKYSIISLEKLNDNTIVCCNEDKNKMNKIRQFKISENNHNFKKISEKNINDNSEVWKLKFIQGRLYFIDKNDNLNFLK